MRPRIRGRDSRDRGVGKDQRAVASQQIAPVDAIAEQERIGVRHVVVMRINFVEPAVVLGDDQRRTTNPQLTARRRDPKGRVSAPKEKLGGRGRGRVGRTTVVRPGACCGEDSRNAGGSANRKREHRGKYTA